jgi:YD repeat-containing protein
MRTPFCIATTAALVLTMISIVRSQNAGATPERPRYDAGGHLTGYQYADGTSDAYAYDSQWRMIRFTDRDGKTTRFSYTADGVMSVAGPDKPYNGTAPR